MDNVVIEEPRDANGIPIRPGYRKPFNSETARAAAAKSVNARVTTKRALQILATIDGLLKQRTHHSKSLKKPRLAGEHGSNRVVSTRDSKTMVQPVQLSGLEKAVQSTAPVDQNASQVKPGGKELPTDDSDCPF